MDDVLVIGAGPAGLLSAWLARRAGLRVRLLAAGIGTTHISPGWIGVLAGRDDGGSVRASVAGFVAEHPEHPYALAGPDDLAGGIAALREVCAPSGMHFVGDLDGENFLLPTALGAARPAALAPESFIAGDLRRPDPILIAGPARWRDFYPDLCAGNLARRGVPAGAVSFDLPETHAGQFDPTPGALARLFDLPDVRARVAGQIRPHLGRAARVGLPAIVGFDHAAEAWQDLQERLGVPVFEIPTLPPSVPGMRLFDAFKAALEREGVPILLDMTVSKGLCDDAGRLATAAAVPGPVRETLFRAGQVILATGGLYGGGLTTDHHGAVREAVFGLPVVAPPGAGNSRADWFDDRLLNEAGHAISYAGIRANAQMQPLGPEGEALLDNVRIAGRLLAGSNPVVEGSTEGIWLATAYRAAQQTIAAARATVQR